MIDESCPDCRHYTTGCPTHSSLVITGATTQAYRQSETSMDRENRIAIERDNARLATEQMRSLRDEQKRRAEVAESALEKSVARAEQAEARKREMEAEVETGVRALDIATERHARLVSALTGIDGVPLLSPDEEVMIARQSREMRLWARALETAARRLLAASNAGREAIGRVLEPVFGAVSANAADACEEACAEAASRWVAARAVFEERAAAAVDVERMLRHPEEIAALAIIEAGSKEGSGT